MQKLDKKTALSLSTKFYRSLPQNTSQAWETFCDRCEFNLNNETTFKTYFSFFFPKRHFKFLNSKKMKDLFEHEIEFMKNATNKKEILIYIYYAVIHREESILSIEAAAYILSKFEYIIIERLLKLFSIPDLIDVPRITKTQLEKCEKIGLLKSRFSLKSLRECSEYFFPFEIKDLNRSSVTEQTLYENSKIFMGIDSNYHFTTKSFSDSISQIIASIVIPDKDRSRSDLANFLTFAKTGHETAIHAARMRILMRNKIAKNPLTNLMISLLYGPFSEENFSRVMRGLPIKIKKLKKKKNDLQSLMKISTDVHENDGLCNEIVDKFIKFHLPMIGKSEYFSLIERFFDGLKSFGEKFPQQYNYAVRCIGYTENKHPVARLKTDFGHFLKSCDTNSEFTLTNYKESHERYVAYDFIACLVKFCDVFPIDTTFFPPLDVESCVERERQIAFESIYFGFAAAYDRKSGYLVCDWGKVSQIITSVISGRFILENGFNCDLSIGQKRYLNLYKHKNKEEKKEGKENTYITPCVFSATRQIIDNGIGRAGDENHLNEFYFSIVCNEYIEDCKENERAIEVPKIERIENLYDIYDGLKDFFKILDSSNLDSEVFFENLFLFLRDKLLEGYYYSPEAVSKLIFLMHMDDELKTKIQNSEGEEVSVSLLDYNYRRSLMGLSFPELNISNYLSKYYISDVTKYYKSDPRVIEAKKNLAKKKEETRKKMEEIKKKREREKRREE